MLQQKGSDSQFRVISLDFLKAGLMLMVVVLHLTHSSMGMANIEAELFSGIWWAVCVLRTSCIVAVDCFVLITGYFMSTANAKYRKIGKLWLQVLMYSVGVYLVLCCIPGSGVTFEVQTLLRQCLPLLTNQYWFMTYYLLLLVVAPMLNRLLKNVDKKEFQKILAALLVTFCFLPSVNIFGDSFGTSNGYSLLWFGVLYLIGAYLRRFPLPKFHYDRIYLGTIAILIVLRALCAGLQSRWEIFGWLGNLLLNYNFVLVLFAAISLFQCALQWQWNPGQRVGAWVSKISGLSLGVYLLHENSQFRNVLWGQIVRLERVGDSTFTFVGYGLLAVLGIFAAGILIEWLRQVLCKEVGALIAHFTKKDNVKKCC